jgi:hypothetical protein
MWATLQGEEMSRFRNLTTALAAVLLTAPAFAYDIQTPGNDTKLSVYGFVYALTNYYTTGSSQNGTQDLVATGFDASAKDSQNILFGIQPSRYGFASVTPNATFGDITTKIEYDNNGLTTGAAFHLRHAYATVGNLLMGQTWSNFVDGDATVDCVDWQGPIGQAGFDTPRRTQIRYTFKFDKTSSLAISLEKNTNIDGDTYSAAATTTTGTAVLNPVTGKITGLTTTTQQSAGVVDTKIPTIVAAYTYADSWGHIGVRAMDIYHAEYMPAVAGVNSSSFSKSTFAGMVSGDVKFGKDDLVFSVMDGQAIDDWGTGFQGAVFSAPFGGQQNVYTYTNLGWVVGYTHVFSPEWRGNIYASGVKFNTNDNIVTSTDYNPAVAKSGTDIKQITDVAVNMFYTVNAKTQFGLEYFYETAKTFGAQSILQQDGTMSDTVKNGRFELVLQAKF